LNTINLQTQTNNESPLRDSSRVKSERALQDLPAYQWEPKDVLQQLQANLSILEDQCGRLNFMMAEVRSNLRR
jgi:hypothetical protein